MASRLSRPLVLGLAATVFVAPLLVLPGDYDASNLPQTAFIDVAAVLLLAVFLVGAWKRGSLELPSPRSLVLPLVFLAWSACSLFWAVDRYEGATTLLHWTCCFLIAVVASVAAPSPDEERFILTSLVASGTLVALLGIAQYLFGFSRIPQAFPPAATFANKNIAAEFAVMVIPIAVWLALSARGVLSLLFTTGSVVIGAYIFYARSRAAYLALAVEVVVFVLARGRSGYRSLRGPAWAALVLLGFLYVGPGGFQNGPWRAYEELVEPLLEGKKPASAPRSEPPASVVSFKARSAIWRNSLPMVSEHPLLGVGLGNHPVYYPRYAFRSAFDPLFSAALELDHAHNDYLQVGAELGLPGLLLFLASVWVAWRAVRPLPEEDVLLALPLVGFLVVAAFAFPLYRAVPPLLLAVLAGLLTRQGGKVTLGFRPARSIPALLFAAALVLGLAWLFGNWIRSDRSCYRMIAAERRQDLVRGRAEAEDARRANPYRKEPLFFLGKMDLETGDAASAAKVLETLVLTHPYDLAALGNLGLAYEGQKLFEKALEVDRRLSALKPDAAVVHSRMAGILEALKRPSDALDEARLAAGAESGNGYYEYRRGLIALQLHLWAEAEEALGRALAIEPGKANAHKALGVLLLQRGRPMEAVAQFKEALSLDPKIPDADHMRGIIEEQSRH